MRLAEAVRTVEAGGQLSRAEARLTFAALLVGEFDAEQLGALLCGLSARGETAAEIAGAADALRGAMRPFPHDHPAALDTCGTGGDGLSTFNLSTAAALVAAACGVRVIKHGNRSASSRCGSADVLEAAGLPLELSAQASRQLLDELGICFLYAPAYHPALRQVAPVRKALGVRTLFNFLGPVCNPGGVRHQVLGVPLEGKLEPMACALEELGHLRALVVHGAGGADELTLAGANHARPVGTLRPFDYDAPTLGLEPAPNSALAGGGPEENLRILRQVFSGEPSPGADAVALNAAAALVVSGVTPSPGEGLACARAALEHGLAADLMSRWVARARELR